MDISGRVRLIKEQDSINITAAFSFESELAGRMKAGLLRGVHTPAEIGRTAVTRSRAKRQQGQTLGATEGSAFRIDQQLGESVYNKELCGRDD